MSRVLLTTPLGEDLRITGLRGRESLSELFAYQIEVVADGDRSVDFGRLLGEEVSVAIEQKGDSPQVRHLHGIVRRVGHLGNNVSQAAYVLDVVPRFWLWTQRVGCRIFQDQTTPQILQQVLAGLDVRFELSADYRVHTYRTQFRESDYQFACRLMEEEGIYFFFQQDQEGHHLVLADNSPMSPELAGGPLRFTGHSSGPDEPRVRRWQKFQELRPARVTLWDHSFQLPEQTLEATRSETATVEAGQVPHQPGLGGKMDLEIFDYPGGYGHRFDGIDSSGNRRPAELQEVFKQNERTARLRLEEQSARALQIEAAGDDVRPMAGFRFGLADLRNAEGDYVVTWVEHDLRVPPPRSGEGEAIVYTNRFGALPLSLTYRPPRSTTRPRPEGPQTATVVGPKGERVHCDPYGRIKVHFYWDRDGRRDGNDSCWVRVATPWAGEGFGMVSLPRVGHEVVVTFLDGDIDRPLVTGSVFNAHQMPPMPLPEKRGFSTITSQSLSGDQEKFTAVTIQDIEKENLTLQAIDDIMLSAGEQIVVTVPEQWTSNIGTLQIQGVGWDFPKLYGAAWKKDSGWERFGDILQDFYGSYRIDVTRGTHGNYTFGLSDQTTLFTRNEVTIDPLSWLSDGSKVQAFFHTLTKYAYGGNLRRVVYGDHQTLGYGSRLTIQSGHLIGLVGTNHVWDKMAKLHAILATSACLLPGLYNLTGNSKFLDAYKVASLLISIYVMGKLVKLQRVYAKEQAFQGALQIFGPFSSELVALTMPSVPEKSSELFSEFEKSLLADSAIEYAKRLTAKVSEIKSGILETHQVHGPYTLDGDWLGLLGREGIYMSMPSPKGCLGIMSRGSLLLGGPNGNMLVAMDPDTSTLSISNGDLCKIVMKENAIELKAGNASLKIGPGTVAIECSDLTVDAFSEVKMEAMSMTLGKSTTKGQLSGQSWNVQ